MGGTDHRHDVGRSFGFSRFLVVRPHSRTALWSRTLPLQKALRPSQLTERYANKYAKAKRVISRLEEELRELRESGGAHPNASEDEREARTAHTSPRPGCTSGATSRRRKRPITGPQAPQARRGRSPGGNVRVSRSGSVCGYRWPEATPASPRRSPGPWLPPSCSRTSGAPRPARPLSSAPGL